MPYTKTDYPEQLQNMKSAAREKWIEVFNSVAKEQDEDTARQAAWKVIGDKYPDKSYMIKESQTFKDIYEAKCKKKKIF